MKRQHKTNDHYTDDNATVAPATSVRDTSKIAPALRRPKQWRVKPVISPPFKIETLTDLIDIAWSYQGDAFDWFRLWRLIPALTELNEMVGLKEVKEKIVNIVLYHIQDLSSTEDELCLHTVISGHAGAGKSACARILAKIYCGMGFLPTDKIVVAERHHFVGKYIGWSDDKTVKLIESAKGGVLFIDEAYSMGNGSHSDSFSKAALDILNRALSEMKHIFVCIIAGYEDELERDFFAVNPGLESRFPIRIAIGEYSPSEVHELFRIKVQRGGWSICENATTDSYFAANITKFSSFGRDIDSYIAVCKEVHSRRILGVVDGKRILTKSDIEKAMESFRAGSKRRGPPSWMYT